ncbi:MAG: hypothetical protein IPI67_26970 [Myxococcales bacterium]|nr:hypothetical protein [Myxococcales bacterium]
MTKSPFRAMCDAIEEMTPATGFNLVGVDEYEPMGEELFLVAHYEDKQAALAALRRTKAADPSGVYYLYSAPGEEVIGSDDPRTQVSPREVVLCVGAEGGSFTLYRERGSDAGWQFFSELNQIALVEMCEDLGDPGPARLKRSSPVQSFEEGLGLLDEKPGWASLYVVEVHPEYREKVLAAVEARVGDDEQALRWWRQKCEADGAREWS